MSWSKELGGYVRTRFPAADFIPLAFFVAAAGLAASPHQQLYHWTVAVVMALSLILQFRLWDDVADRQRDKQVHPDRVLSRTPDIRPFLVAATVLFVFNGALLAWYHGPVFRIAAYILLCACLAGWYFLRSTSMVPGLLNSALVLAKYPVIAFLVGAGADHELPLLLSCLSSVYLLFVIYEIRDDRDLAQLPGAAGSRLAALIVLLSIWVFIPVRTGPHESLLTWFVWAFVILGTATLGLSGHSAPTDSKRGRGGRGLFLLGLIAYLALAIETSR